MSKSESAKETGVSAALRGVGVTLVMPCLNEELAIGICVQRAFDVMKKFELDGSVLVVDNGSTDRSVEIAHEHGARVVYQPEQGYGAALRSGFEAAETEFVIMADADGTYELEAIPRLLEPLVEGTSDLVLGSRLDNVSLKAMPWLHRFVGTPSISLLVNHASRGRIKVRDSQSGFRAFRREELAKLHLTSTGMEFASEMLIRCAWANMRITEVETTYSERIGVSKLNTFSDGMRHLRQILLLSPEAFATIPGIAMILAAIGLWSSAATSMHGLGRTGSLSWLANLAAGLLSVTGPLVLCTGLVLRYRAESTGLRHDHVKLPINLLIKRFFIAGVLLITTSLLLITGLIINFHRSRHFLTLAESSSLSSFARSALLVGTILAAVPLISPFFLSSPRFQLPPPEEDV